MEDALREWIESMQRKSTAVILAVARNVAGNLFGEAISFYGAITLKMVYRWTIFQNVAGSLLKVMS